MVYPAVDRVAVSIRADDLTSDPVRVLVELHLSSMRTNSPPGHVFAIDAAGLLAPDVTVFTAWRDQALAGTAALRALDACAGEIKSMRTHPDHLRSGVAAALLDHLEGEARRRGYTRLSLETGSGPAFEPAIAFYCRRGFVPGEAFGDYAKSDFNRFLHLAV